MKSKAGIHTKRKGPFSFSRWTFLLIAIVLIGTAFSFVLYQKVMEWQVRLFTTEFHLRAETHAKSLQKGIDRSLEMVEAIAGFYASSVKVTREEFREFVRSALEDHPEIHSLGWVQSVSARDRRQFETELQLEDGTTFQITEKGPSHETIPAAPRSRYYPVVRLAPVGLYDDAIGFDMASDPVLAASLDFARDHGKMMIVSRTPLTNFGEQNGFFVLQPVFDSALSNAGLAMQQKKLKGFALGVFQIANVVKEALRGMEKLGIDFEIVEEGRGTLHEVFLYAHASRTRKELSGPSPSVPPSPLQDLVSRSMLSVPGRDWVLVAYPAPALLATFHPYEARAVFLAGILFTGFLSTLFLLMARRYVQREEYFENLTCVNKRLEREVEERIRADRALKESEEKFRMLFDTAADGVLLVKPEEEEAVIVDCNPKALELFGAAREDLIGKQPYELAPDMQPDGRSSREKGKAMMRTALEGDCPVFEWQPRRLDGTLFDTEIILKRVCLKGMDHVQAILRDITLRKKMEQELLKREKLESLGLLAGGLAHDFNNLLTVILGNLSLAQYQSPLDGNVEDLLMDAEKATLRAQGLTQQLLTFAKGGAPVIRTATVEKVVRESANFALRGSNVRCEILIPEGLHAVEIDEGQISQVIHNLVLNADQAMPEGGILRIACENVRLGVDAPVPLPKGDYVRINVTDEGCGISTEYQQRIFDPYFTTKQKGSGLGLAGSYSIIKRHKGHLSVHSKPGQGATFSIYLPASSNVQEKAEGETKPLQRGTGRILIMDDEPFIRKVAGDILRHLGYRVAEVQSGEEAIKLYSRARENGDPFSAVILDLTIPGGMGGEEALQELRKIDPEVKAIVSSGYADDPIMADYKSYGFASVAAKPYQMRTLSEAVLRALEVGRIVENGNSLSEL